MVRHAGMHELNLWPPYRNSQPQAPNGWNRQAYREFQNEASRQRLVLFAIGLTRKT